MISEAFRSSNILSIVVAKAEMLMLLVDEAKRTHTSEKSISLTVASSWNTFCWWLFCFLKCSFSLSHSSRLVVRLSFHFFYQQILCEIISINKFRFRSIFGGVGSIELNMSNYTDCLFLNWKTAKSPRAHRTYSSN